MYDSRYDSKMHNIIIPLMGFKGFHHASNHESKDDFEDFIGREGILDKLHSWLKDNEAKGNKKYSGAYLISGFRGMGKSSFVYKTILDIKTEAKRHRFKTCHYVPISINVGNDLLTSKELLYIICKLLSSSFEEKTRWGHNKRSQLNLAIAYLIMILALVISLIIYFFNKDNILHSISSFIQDNIYYIPAMIVGMVLIFYSMRYLYYFIWTITDWPFFITTWQIKRTFKRLNERIDSEMTESSEYGIDSSENAKPFDVVPGLRLLKSKSNIYHIAQTSEIQDLLVSQLNLIKRLEFAKFRFIFIIDELDKVSPEDEDLQIIPEYEYRNAVKGNSSYRSRQKALAELLTNMKYFISTSEAKFVFITGYDMYEATLADISNREFNIHSIFNGYINVSSFMRKTSNSSGADAMIEEYFTHRLLREQDGNRKDLRDYANFYRQEWDKMDDLSERQLEYLEQQLERRILFMRHFLTYLFYMSNGSPKKLAMYLEKYIRSKNRIREKYENQPQQDSWIDYRDEISLGVDSFWEECEWFLFFDERSIQKIEFINYLIYPMIKNLIAKSSIYNDKLLVSTSFMISNLYKFHKSGFSWRNLEYMPELLDINKTPELRDFIGGILQFLNQTHIDEAAVNLYKFKFPQRLSEEITFYSKTAEEVSYLFNFSYDELSSIKTLYNKELDHYTKMEYEAPAIASLHHLLGDIYMLEENYEQAIFEFNEALTAITRQEKYDPKSLKDSSHILFRVRVSLKLGLANEKRKTFDTAYITYENLVKYLLETASNVIQLPIIEEKRILPTISQHLDSNASFFANIRIAYLGILAKVAVIEKMDFGGIDDHDLWKLSREFDRITSKLGEEFKSVAVMDFHSKLGCILYYKNSRNSSEQFINILQEILGLTYSHDKTKFKECTSAPVSPLSSHSRDNTRLLTPCTGCQYFNKSLKVCMEVLDDKYGLEENDKKEKTTRDYAETSKAVFFLKHFNDKELSIKVYQKGNLFLQVMSNTLVGLGNTLLSCSKIKSCDLAEFFKTLNVICKDLDKGLMNSLSLLKSEWLGPYTKSILYYLAAADSFKMLTDYKASYNIYIQILDAIAVYYKMVANAVVPATTLDFCRTITRKAIHCAYLHYDSINCAEVDTQKHEFGKSPIDYINLHSLAVFPEVEVAVDKYLRISLMGDESEQDKVLGIVLNSRQISSNKLIATLTQNIQNLSLKVAVNEIVLKRIIPDLGNALNPFDLGVTQEIEWITDYYLSDQPNVDDLLDKWSWKLFMSNETSAEKRFYLLDYLVKDSLYCLNKMIELLEPLYSTTLYNNSYIGELYRKAFYWNHILIRIGELYGYAETKDKTSFMENLKSRYSSIRNPNNYPRILDLFMKTDAFMNSLPSWKDYCPEDMSRVQGIYQKICPGGSYLLTSRYLIESAMDRHNKAIEMHTSGKAYKEMMSTLFFLEDDLQNDTNYMHLAIERLLINHDVVHKRIEELRKHTVNNSNLTQIEYYVKP